jgi:SAM-dependent methyltransferase
VADKAQELAAIVQEIRDRVRRQHPDGRAGALQVPLPDLLPILHAKDAAEAKVAAIGSVNPRPPGFANNLIQGTKRRVARALQWFVRDQVDFNRSMLGVVDALLNALNEQNRVTVALAQRLEEMQASAEQRVAEALAESARIRAEARELTDVRTHWYTWRLEWEQKLVQNEAILLRSVADLQAGFQHRLALLEAGHRELVSQQHANFAQALDKRSHEMQEQVWKGLAELRQLYQELRLEHERHIRGQFQMLQVRAAKPEVASSTSPAQSPIPIDYRRFAARFRGSEESIRERMRWYVPLFREHSPVLDLGCGRGEFLQLLGEAGIQGRGVDLDVEAARDKGLDVVEGDFFRHLESLPDASLGGIFCSQVVEHLEPARVPALISLAASKLRSGGLLAIETPDPASLAIFATHFYIDPTHTRPVPSALAAFYMEEAGFGAINVHRLAPAIEAIPSLSALPDDLREALFGGLDYAIVGYRL